MDSTPVDSTNHSNVDAHLPLWRRSNPFIQNLLIAACLFCNPGMYLAIATLGAGGGRPSSTSMGDISNGVLYGVFTFSAILAPTVLNKIGPRLTMIFAISGYPLYTGSLWCFDVQGHLWFPVFAGAYLGLSAGCLWTTASFVSNTYSEEKDKGVWRAIQWVGNITGATIGGCVALGINWNATTLGVPHSVYIVFIIIQCASMLFALLLVEPKDVLRPDGTHIAQFETISILESLHITAKLLTDWRILLMIPTFFTPELFFPLQSSMNAYAFNLRSRTLNSVLGNAFQIPTTIAMGYILDNENFGKRKTRAYIAIAIDAVWITGAYIAQTAWLASWKFNRSIPGPSIDVTDAAYPGAVVIYLLYNAQYGIFQNVVIWMFGSLTNEPRKQGAICGLFVGILSSGTAISFGTDATLQPYENENAAFFALATICWPILFFIAYKCCSDTNYFKEDNVIVPIHVQYELQVESIADGTFIEGVTPPGEHEKGSPEIVSNGIDEKAGARSELY